MPGPIEITDPQDPTLSLVFSVSKPVRREIVRQFAKGTRRIVLNRELVYKMPLRAKVAIASALFGSGYVVGRETTKKDK